MAKNFKFINASAHTAYVGLPVEIQQQFGNDLNAVQQGTKPFSSFKDLSASVGAGAIELIENGSPGYRAVYCAKYLETVYILHAFTKTTNGVDKAAMKTAAARYKEMMKEVDAEKKEAKKEKRKK